MGHLGGAVDGEATVVAGNRGHTVRLHRGHGHPLVDVAAADDHLGIAEDARVAGVGDGQRHVVTVLREDHGRTLGHRVLGVHHRGQRVVVHHYRVGGVLRLHRGLGQDDGDRFADEAHHAVGQWRPAEVVVHLGHPVERGEAEVVVGQDGGDTGHGRSVGDVHADHSGMGELGAHEAGVQRVVQVQVGDVARLTGEQFRVFGAQHPGSEDRSGHPAERTP